MTTELSSLRGKQNNHLTQEASWDLRQKPQGTLVRGSSQSKNPDDLTSDQDILVKFGLASDPVKMEPGRSWNMNCSESLTRGGSWIVCAPGAS